MIGPLVLQTTCLPKRSRDAFQIELGNVGFARWKEKIYYLQFHRVFIMSCFASDIRRH